jgi:hypothetical protein
LISDYQLLKNDSAQWGWLVGYLDSQQIFMKQNVFVVKYFYDKTIIGCRWDELLYYLVTYIKLQIDFCVPLKLYKLPWSLNKYIGHTNKSIPSAFNLNNNALY